MKKNNFGFTLIELLVAITIGILVVGFGSVALNNFNEDQKVESVKQELMANLRLARNYAITNQLKGGDYLKVTMDSDGLLKLQSYNKDGSFVTDGMFFSQDITPNNISITQPLDVSFTVFDGRSINGDVNITIIGDNGTTKNIKINELGLIYEE